MRPFDPIDYELYCMIVQWKEYDRQQSEAAQMLKATAKNDILASLKEIERLNNLSWDDDDFMWVDDFEERSKDEDQL